MTAGNHRVIAVHGPAGGTGKTLLSIHLAYLLAARGCRTVLVELTQYGGITPFLRLPRAAGNVSTVTGALRDGVADLEAMRAALVPAPGMESTLHLLLSGGPARMDQITADGARSLLGHLAAQAQVVLADTGSELTDRTLGALLAADRIVLVLCPQVAHGWQAMELLDILRSACIPTDRIAAVFNRVRRGGRYGLEEYREVLGLPVLGTIPECASLRLAPERGGPPDVRRSSREMVALRRIAHGLVPIFHPKELRRRWLWSR